VICRISSPSGERSSNKSARWMGKFFNATSSREFGCGKFIV
jgi:hypothetical protein